MTGTLAITGVCVQRATAHLLDRSGDPMPVALEHAHCGSFGLTERFSHHASGEKA